MIKYLYLIIIILLFLLIIKLLDFISIKKNQIGNQIPRYIFFWKNSSPYALSNRKPTLKAKGNYKSYDFISGRKLVNQSYIDL
jgi:hypothetical protein